MARIALCALCARAAVPPLDPDAREETADLIVVGRIVSATAEEVSRREGHVDSVSIGQLEVEVALKGDADMTIESLKRWCEGELSAYKIPKKLLVMDTLPRNAMGKVVKPTLKTLFS